MHSISNTYIRTVVQQALQEDHAKNDITSKAIFSSHERMSAVLFVKEPGVLAGLFCACEAFRVCDPHVRISCNAEDGMVLKKGAQVLKIEGKSRGIAAAERTALNFLGHLSGIATLTREYVCAAAPVNIYDTRKTTPGLRMLEKYAVRMGGGYNHRMDMEEHFLIKDNHINAYQQVHPQSTLAEIIKKARQYNPTRRIEIEVETQAQFEQAMEAAPDIIMLDNMSLQQIRHVVCMCAHVRSKKRRPLLEVSGGVDLAQVKRLAQTGVDRISVGRITHSARSLDFSLEIQ